MMATPSPASAAAPATAARIRPRLSRTQRATAPAFLASQLKALASAGANVAPMRNDAALSDPFSRSRASPSSAAASASPRSIDLPRATASARIAASPAEPPCNIGMSF